MKKHFNFMGEGSKEIKLNGARMKVILSKAIDKSKLPTRLKCAEFKVPKNLKELANKTILI